MAEEKRTVFFKIEDAGNLAPLTGFSKVKVKLATGSAVEANKAANLDGTLLTGEIQQCYFVTVNANVDEEAAKLVDLLTSGQVDPISGSEIQGPKLGGNLNNTKVLVTKSNNLAETTVQP